LKLRQALNSAKKLLADKESEAVFILCEYLKKDRTWLLLNEDLEFDEKPYFKLINSFHKGEPFEYIFKKANFYGLEFKIEKGVLIPRYDSEILLELCLQELKQKAYNNILEIGFGSGILSIVLAKLLAVKITACDINKKALKIAKDNAKIHKVDHLIKFVLKDFRELRGEFDFIFSNPPYIKNNYKCDKWVKKEPKNALFGGEKGYEFLEEIINFSCKKGVKVLACEFGYDQKEFLEKILESNFKSKFFKDERGFDRAFMAYFIEK